MTDRERLIDLIHKCDIKSIPTGEFIEGFADYLLANGVFVSPVKVGDIVYRIYPIQGILPCKISRIQYGSYGLLLVYKHGAFSVDKIGKNVFLNRKDAEDALVELRANTERL